MSSALPWKWKGNGETMTLALDCKRSEAQKISTKRNAQTRFGEHMQSLLQQLYATNFLPLSTNCHSRRASPIRYGRAIWRRRELAASQSYIVTNTWTCRVNSLDISQALLLCTIYTFSACALDANIRVACDGFCRIGTCPSKLIYTIGYRSWRKRGKNTSWLSSDLLW